MDKYGVTIEEDSDKTKTAAATQHCPDCGAELEKGGVPKCPNCGTRPFEKRPNKEK